MSNYLESLEGKQRIPVNNYLSDFIKAGAEILMGTIINDYGPTSKFIAITALLALSGSASMVKSIEFTNGQALEFQPEDTTVEVPEETTAETIQ